MFPVDCVVLGFPVSEEIFQRLDDSPLYPVVWLRNADTFDLLMFNPTYDIIPLVPARPQAE